MAKKVKYINYNNLFSFMDNKKDSVFPFPETNVPNKTGMPSFGKKKKQEGININIANELSSVTTRLRLVEEKYNNLRKKLQFIEQNFLNSRKKQNAETKTIISDIKEIRKEVEELKGVVRHIIEELDSFAKHEEVMVIKKYMDFFEPLNFVTHKEVEKLIDEKIDEKIKNILERSKKQV